MPSIGELPEFNLRAFLAPSHLPVVVLCLTVGEPARVFIALAHSDYHQMNGVAAAIRFPRSRIHRHLECTRLPRPLPGCDSLLEGSDDAVGDFLAEIAFDWSPRRGHRGPLHSMSGSGISASKPEPSSCSPANDSSRS